MKTKSLLVACVALLVLSITSVSMAASIGNEMNPGLGFLGQTEQNLDQISADANVAYAAGDRLRDGSCGNTPIRDGSGNPNAPRRGGGRK